MRVQGTAAQRKDIQCFSAWRIVPIFVAKQAELVCRLRHIAHLMISIIMLMIMPISYFNNIYSTIITFAKLQQQLFNRHQSKQSLEFQH
jgi:hypothetical protein